MATAGYIGVDVGTASVRAALVNCQGHVVQQSVSPIRIHNPKQDFYEQSSHDIWLAVCATVRRVVFADQVSGIPLCACT